MAEVNNVVFWNHEMVRIGSATWSLLRVHFTNGTFFGFFGNDDLVRVQINKRVGRSYSDFSLDLSLSINKRSITYIKFQGVGGGLISIWIYNHIKINYKNYPTFEYLLFILSFELGSEPVISFLNRADPFRWVRLFAIL